LFLWLLSHWWWWLAVVLPPGLVWCGVVWCGLVGMLCFAVHRLLGDLSIHGLEADE
jgi:hypothetical protein